jgi:hypothetical protein
MKRTARIERRNSIICAYAIALGADLIPLPPAMAARAVCAALPDVTESEVFAAARWAIRWHSGRVREYWKFDSALDSEGMNAALLEVYQRCKPQCDRRASFSHGKSGGYLGCVPHDAGAAAVAIICEYYSKALQAMRASPEKRKRADA